jgi:Zn-dependent protease with chaperone function
MSTAVNASAVPFSRKWHWPVVELFRDLRVRYGIKMGLAGILSLYLTQVLRLPHDNWAILTVLVMMSAQYVGSLAVKAILRVVGTIGGAIIGVWLVGDYTSTPMIFLPLFFLVLALSSYKYGQFGARQSQRRHEWDQYSRSGVASRNRSVRRDSGRIDGRAPGISAIVAALRPRRIRSRQRQEPQDDW